MNAAGISRRVCVNRSVFPCVFSSCPYLRLCVHGHLIPALRYSGRQRSDVIPFTSHNDLFLRRNQRPTSTAASCFTQKNSKSEARSGSAVRGAPSGTSSGFGLFPRPLQRFARRVCEAPEDVWTSESQTTTMTRRRKPGSHNPRLGRQFNETEETPEERALPSRCSKDSTSSMHPIQPKLSHERLLD